MLRIPGSRVAWPIVTIAFALGAVIFALAPLAPQGARGDDGVTGQGGIVVPKPPASPTATLRPHRKTPTPKPKPSPSPSPSPTVPPGTLLPRVVVPSVAGEGQPPPLPQLPPDPMPGLRAAIEQARNAWPENGDYAMAITDLQTGETIGIDMDVMQLSGCVMNIFVLISALQDVEQGYLTFEQVDSLIRATLWSSNSSTARQLYALVGGGNVLAGFAKVQARLDDLGLSGMLVDHARPGTPGKREEWIRTTG